MRDWSGILTTLVSLESDKVVFGFFGPVFPHRVHSDAFQSDCHLK